MRYDLRQLMSGLRSDHRNMSLLLDLLDAETGLLAASAEPDYELVADIMRYMTEYPDAIHHPREDLIYRHLRSLHPDIERKLQRVETDHRYIEQSGLKLRNDFAAISDGADPGRDEMITRLRQYSGQLREHMYWEEQDLFRRADELQDDDKLLANLSEHAESDDPLFGLKVQRKYRRLLGRIQQRVVWDSQKYMV